MGWYPGLLINLGMGFLVCGPVWACPPLSMPERAALVPAEGGAYRPDVDVEGRAVPAADLDPATARASLLPGPHGAGESPVPELPDQLSLDIRLNPLGDRPLTPGLFGEALVVTVPVDLRPAHERDCPPEPLGASLWPNH